MRRLYRERQQLRLKGPDDPPSRAMIEAHNFTHLPAAPWFAICVQARGKSNCHTRVKYHGEIPCVRMDFQFISGVAVWCPEAHAKATVVTVDMDTCCVGVLMVSGKSLDNFVVRSTASFVEFGHPRSIILKPINYAIKVLGELREHIRVFQLPHEH